MDRVSDIQHNRLNKMVTLKCKCDCAVSGIKHKSPINNYPLLHHTHHWTEAQLE